MNPGDQIGDYRIVDSIGAGGSGRVYRVRHEITGRIEAMKVLLPDQSEEDELCDRFLREVRIHARLVHPNIASLVTAFWTDRRLMMVMEYVEGESLDRLLSRERLPLPQALRYASQALAGLSYAHAHGVTHRDVKPENLLIGAEKVLKVTDFGLARTAKDIRLTKTGALMGSLYYVSPEQLRGFHLADERSDIYSMGAVLYEMVTGRRPFLGAEAFELMMAHDKLQPPTPAKLDAAIPPPLSKAIMKALQKDPRDRFASADEFRHAIEAVLASLPQEAEVTSGNDRKGDPTVAVQTQVKSWKALAAGAPRLTSRAAAAALALTVVTASMWFLPSRLAKPAPEGTIQAKSTIPGTPAELIAADGFETAIRALLAPPRAPLWWAPEGGLLVEREPEQSGPKAAVEVARLTPASAKTAQPQSKQTATTVPELAPAVVPSHIGNAAQTTEVPKPPAADAAAAPTAHLELASQPLPVETPGAPNPSGLPEKVQIRLLTAVGSDDGSRSPVTGEVTLPAELAGARIEGQVVDSKSSRRPNGESSLEIEFVTLHHLGRTMSIESHVVQLRNSKGASGVDDNGHKLKRDDGVLGKGKKAAVRIGSAIGGLFGRGNKTDDAESPSSTTVLSASAPRIAFLPGSEFDLSLVAWGQVGVGDSR